MYGAILGDIFGSIYEGRSRNRKTDNPEEIDLLNPRCHFTDDSVLTIAVAEALLNDRDYKSHVIKWANRHPHAGYGGMFKRWFRSDDPQPYNSFGNGSAMRVSPIGWVCKSLDETLIEAERSAAISHNHPEGTKGAQAVAAAVFLAQINSKADIKAYIEETFGYDLKGGHNDLVLWLTVRPPESHPESRLPGLIDSRYLSSGEAVQNQCGDAGRFRITGAWHHLSKTTCRQSSLIRQKQDV